LKKKLPIIIVILVIIVGFICYTQLTIFVIQPIGALPEGATLVISRLNLTKFIDSPDAICERIQGGVSLLGRGLIMAKVVDTAKIYLRLPYSKSLYLISTGGMTYEQ